MQISRAWRYWQSNEVGGGINKSSWSLGFGLNTFGCVSVYLSAVETFGGLCVWQAIVLVKAAGPSWGGNGRVVRANNANVRELLSWPFIESYLSHNHLAGWGCFR